VGIIFKVYTKTLRDVNEKKLTKVMRHSSVEIHRDPAGMMKKIL
jgi:hypothetical protein